VLEGRSVKFAKSRNPVDLVSKRLQKPDLRNKIAENFVAYLRLRSIGPMNNFWSESDSTV
jgi:hypothetical protein